MKIPDDADRHWLRWRIQQHLNRVEREFGFVGLIEVNAEVHRHMTQPPKRRPDNNRLTD